MTSPQEERISLYCKNATSDKEYHLQLVAEGDAFMVYYQNGPRGGTLTHGKKTPSPVDYAVAKKKYDAVVKEKTKGGYSPGEAGTAFVGTDLEDRITGLDPQLLNAIAEARAQELINDSAWALQQKYDGQRRMACRRKGRPLGANRRGLAVPLTVGVAASLDAMKSDGGLEVDGEQMGDTLVLFDVLMFDGVDLRNSPYRERLAQMDRLAATLDAAGQTGVVVIQTAVTTEEKRALYERMREEGQEGVVFKRLDSPYVPGRPASGGDQLKRKFVHQASCLVASLHATKRSVGLALLDENGASVPQGNCKIPVNYDIPKVGQVVEVQYLYAFRGGRLFQAQYQGVRTDILPAECLTAQLHYKASTDTDEDDEADEADES